MNQNQAPQETCDEICLVTDAHFPSEYQGITIVVEEGDLKDIRLGRTVYRGYVVDAQLPGLGIALSIILGCAINHRPLALVIDRSRNSADRIEFLSAFQEYGVIVLFTKRGKPPQETLLQAAKKVATKIRNQALISVTDTIRGR